MICLDNRLVRDIILKETPFFPVILYLTKAVLIYLEMMYEGQYFRSMLSSCLLLFSNNFTISILEKTLILQKPWLHNILFQGNT